MQKNATSVFVTAVGALAAMMWVLPPANAASDPAGSEGRKMTPIERVKATEKGKLTNPLSVTPEISAEGKQLYQVKTCGACHGGNAKGNHGPSLVNDAWVYGSDDDTLFRLVTNGSEKLQSEGYIRGDQEKHAGPMPGFGETISDEQDIWKIITYIRSVQASTENN